MSDRDIFAGGALPARPGRVPGRVKEKLEIFLRSEAVEDGLVPLAATRAVAGRFSLSLSAVERFVLKIGLFPLRYRRQRGLFGTRGQLRLLRARVGVIGCGGLGGAIFEMLVRAGTGTILAVDFDIFSESNLNRQALCSVEGLGRPKAEVARQRALSLNPAVEVIPLVMPFQEPAARQRLAGCDLVFDGLDSIPARLELAAFCAASDLYLVHGAVAGWCGQTAVIPPGGNRLAEFYPAGKASPDNPEPVNLAPTVNAVAAFQVAAGLRFLLGDQAPDSLSGGAFLDLSGPELETWS